MKKGIITNIQHYCYQDGPGLRTTVFFKGCSLRCKWCANPENMLPGIEPEWSEETEGSLCMSGYEVTVDDVLQDVLRDYLFYLNSGGGLTTSGGEPLLQWEFVAELFGRAHQAGITTALETAGHVPWTWMETVLRETDDVLYDLKLMEKTAHRKWTGADNDRILENFCRAATEFPDIVFYVRMPVIAGINDGADHLEQMIAFLRPYQNVAGIELLPYHRLGIGKYRQTGKTYELEEASAPDETQMELLRDLIRQAWPD